MTSRHVPPPKTVCPECGERCERLEPTYGTARDRFVALVRCPHCGKATPHATWKHYTPEEAEENRARVKAREREYREAHKAEAAERKRRWYECNGDEVRAVARRRYRTDDAYRARILKEQRERRWAEKHGEDEGRVPEL